MVGKVVGKEAGQEFAQEVGQEFAQEVGQVRIGLGLMV